MTTVLYERPSGIPTFVQVKVACDAPENKIVFDYLKRPEIIEAWEMISEGTNCLLDPDEPVGYEDGEADITVNIIGTKVPNSNDFGVMIREFFTHSGFMWTSEFEQAILSEVVRATEI